MWLEDELLEGMGLYLMQERLSETEMTHWEHEIPEELGKPGAKGTDTESVSGDALEAEPEQAGVPTTGSEIKDQGPVKMNRPDPIDRPGVHLEFEGKMVPIEQFHLQMPKERLIPAGMENTYVTQKRTRMVNTKRDHAGVCRQ